MKLKPLAGIVLVVGLTTGLWLWFYHPTLPVQKSVTKLIKPDIAPLPKSVPAETAKMTTVMAKPVTVQSPTLSPAKSDWLTVQKTVDGGASYEERLKAI